MWFSGVSNELHNYELPWHSWILTLESKLEEKIDTVNNRVIRKVKKHKVPILGVRKRNNKHKKEWGAFPNDKRDKRVKTH